MGVIADLVARISGDVSGLRKSLGDGAASTDDFAKSWIKAGSDIDTAATRIATVIGTVTGAIVGYTARMGVAFNSMKEDSIASFTVMLKSAEKAQEMMAGIQSLAAKTPLESTDITQAAKTLLQFGVAGDSVLPMLKRLGDATGGNSQQFKSMALAYGQMSSAGRLMGQDLLQMVGNGFNPLNEIAKRTGESMATLKERMEKGGVGVDEVKQAFVDATSEGGQFFNLMDVRSQTMSGLWSTMIDNLKATSGKIFEPLSEGLKGFLEKIVAGFDGGSFNTTIQRLQEAVAAIMHSIEEMAESNGPGILKGIADGFLFLADATVKVTDYVRAQGPALMQTAASWGSLLTPILTFLAQNPQVLAALLALKVSGMFGLTSALMSLFQALMTTSSMLAGFATSAGTAGAAATGMATASTGLAASLAAFAPLGIALLITGIALAANRAADELYGMGEKGRVAAEKMKKLDAEHDDRRATERMRNREEVGEETNPAERKKLLQQQLAEAKLNAKGLENQDRGASQAARDAAWGASNVTSKIMTLGYARGGVSTNANAEAADVHKRAQEAAAEVRRLQEEVFRIERQEKAKELQEAKKEEAERLGMDVDHFDKLKEMQDYLSKPTTTDRRAEKFAGKVDGATPEMAKQFAANFAASDKSQKSLEDLALTFMKATSAAKAAIESGGDGNSGTKIGEKAAKAIEDKLVDAEHRSKEKQFDVEGFDRLRDFIGAKGVTTDQATRYAGTVKGASPDLVKEFSAAFENSDKSKESLDHLALTFMQIAHAAEESDKHVEGMNEKLRDMKGVVPDGMIASFSDHFKTLGDQLRDGAIDADQYKDALKNLNNRMEDAKQAAVAGHALENHIDDQKGKISKTEFGDGEGISQEILTEAESKFDEIGKKAIELANAFVQGDVSAAKFAEEMGRLRKATDDVTDTAVKAGSATMMLSSAIDKHEEDLSKHDFGQNRTKGVSESVAHNAASKYDAIDAEGEKLARSFQAGKISAAALSQEMARLKRATDDVADAALREESQKRKEALARGDFKGAGLDFNKAVQDKLADQQMQQFDQAVTDFMNQFVPLTQTTQQIVEGFGYLYDGMNKFGQKMASTVMGGGFGGGGQNDSAALAWYAQYVNSIAGMIASLQNTMSFHEQALTILTDPQRRQQELDAINGLTDQINKLNSTVSTFNGYRSNDPIFSDPGLTGVSGPVNTTNNVNVNVPSMVSATQGELDWLANSMANSLSRQGHPAFR